MKSKTATTSALPVLQPERDSIQKQIRALEAQGVRPAAANSIDASARALLGAEAAAPSKSEQLLDLYQRREILDAAIRIESARLAAEKAKRDAAVMRDRDGDWRENVKQTSLAIARLWKLNAAREELVASFGGVAPQGMPSVHQRLLLGCGQPGQAQSDSGRRFIEQAILAGIISEREISRV
jgi:hypothetical protein